MRGLGALLLCLAGLGIGTVAAEEERPPACDLPAVRFEPDARLLQIYDGLRRGLEKAQLPRVCLEAVEESEAGLDAFARTLEARAETLRAEGRPPLVAFGFGDRAADALGGRAVAVPRVFVLSRYSLEGRPLAPLPVPRGPSAVVYADFRIERVGEVVRDMLESKAPTVALAVETISPGTRERLDAIEAVTRLHFVALGEADADVRAVLHLRLGIGERLVSFRDAAVAARKRRVPLVCDDPARFRLGVVPVVLATHAELVGRYAAEAARLLSRAPDTAIQPRAVVATRVLVDLRASDAQGLQLPLPFLAGAHELTRGMPRDTPGPAR